MALSNDLISQFIKSTNDDTGSKKKEATVYGTTVEYEGTIYVRIDGSNQLTPVSTTAGLKADQRVTVMIKNHSAIVTGNITDPSASSSGVTELNNKISEFGIIVADKVSTDQLNAQTARIDTLVVENATIKGTLSVAEADIDELQAKNVTIDGKLVATDAEISNIKANKLDVVVAEASYATIENLDVTNAKINNLEATYGDFEVLATNKFTAIEGDITNLRANSLTAADITGKFANIDFSNIGEATMQKFYANSGLIKDVVVNDGTITGELVGVTISGDLIVGNTIKAEKLVIKGSDGFYYKLNTDGMAIEAEQTNENSLNGSIIQAKSITATKINVSDLVAFGATIGGFKIAEHSIYSGVKSSVNNTTRGIYLDDDGQIAFGDANGFVKFYRDTDSSYKLAISAERLLLGANGKNIEEHLDDVRKATGDTADQLTAAQSLIEQLSNSISMMVTDGNGTSLMKQTADGWTFSTSDLQKSIGDVSDGLNNLTNDIGSVSGTVDTLQKAVEDLSETAEYVRIGVYEDEPCIELGESDSKFKLLITNTRMIFLEGSSELAYFNNQSLHIKKAVIEEEFQLGGFVWKIRSNGNMGLVWKGVSS